MSSARCIILIGNTDNYISVMVIKMNNNYEIKTDRLLLHTLTESDVAIVRSINGDEFKTDEAARGFIRWQDDAGRLLINFYIWLTQEDKCIGRVYIHSKPELNYEVEIGYGILEAYRNKGYATEAAKVTVHFAFSQAGQKVLCAIVKPENISSRRVTEKLGFVYNGVRRVADENGLDCDFDYFQLSYNDWQLLAK